MNKRYNRRLNISVSEIGFGAWQLGSDGGTWDRMDKEYGIQLVQEAVSKGVTFYDTAPGYGNGNSETILGEARIGVRDKVHINTKIGHGPNGEYEFSVEGVHTSIKRSLQKLKTNYVDTVILHNPQHYILEGKTDLFDVLKEYKQKGIIKGYGVSIDSFDELETVLKYLDIDVIEIMFNMIHQEPRYLFDQIKEKGILLIIKIPFDSGWLTGKYHKDTVFSGVRSRWNQEEKEIRNDIVNDIKTILQKDDISVEALQYILRYNAVSTIIPGTRTINQLEKNIEASKSRLNDTVVKKIETLYETKIKDKHTPW